MAANSTRPGRAGQAGGLGASPNHELTAPRSAGEPATRHDLYLSLSLELSDDLDRHEEAGRRRTQLREKPLQPPTARFVFDPVGNAVLRLVDVARDQARSTPDVESQVAVPVVQLGEVPADLPHTHALRVHALQPPACGERGERRIALGRVHQEHDEAALEHLARETAGQLTSGRSPAVVARGSRLGTGPPSESRWAAGSSTAGASAAQDGPSGVQRGPGEG